MAEKVLIKLLRSTQAKLVNAAEKQLDAGQLGFATDSGNLFIGNGVTNLLIGRVLIGSLASRPSAGSAGLQYYADDTDQLFLDVGTGWVQTNVAGSGGTEASISNVIFVDKHRQDAYTPNGSITRPYKTISSAVAAVPSANSLSNPYTIEIAPGEYDENVVLNNDNLKNVIIRGLGTVYINPSSGNAWECSSNNNGFQRLVVENLVFDKPFYMNGEQDAGNTFSDSCVFVHCLFNDTVTVKNVHEFALSHSGVMANYNLENVFYAMIRNGDGIGGFDAVLTWIGGNPKPSGVTEGNLVVEDTLALANFTVGAGFNLQAGEGTRLGSPTSTLDINGTVKCYASYLWAGTVTVNNGGSLAVYGTFFNRAALTVNAGGSFLNGNMANNIAFNAITPGIWKTTVPDNVQDALQRMADVVATHIGTQIP
jgi:hypothetical protein